MEVVAGFFYVWVERKYMGLASGGKKIYRFVFKFVGWVCVYVCWLGLIGGGGCWIFLCLGREKISRFGFEFEWKENSMFKFVGWVCVYVCLLNVSYFSV